MYSYRFNTGKPVVPQKYTLTWLKGTKIHVCYGCNKNIRPKPQANLPEFLPPAPFDVVLRREELRMYHKPGGELTYSFKPQNCYYEMKKKCVLKRNNHFTADQIEISENDWKKLSELHVNVLRKEFGIIK